MPKIVKGSFLCTGKQYLQMKLRSARSGVRHAASRAFKNTSLAGFTINNLPILAVLPLIIESPVQGLPFVFFHGICNLQCILFENLGNIISGIKERNDELIRHFQKEIDAIKNNIVTFIGRMVKDLQNEMGFDSTSFNLDNHEISHVFEEWLKDTDLNNLADPAESKRLRQMLKDKIGLQTGDEAYAAIVDKHLESGEFLDSLAGQMKDLRGKTQEYLDEDLPAKKAPGTGTEDGDTLPPKGKEGGKNRDA